MKKGHCKMHKRYSPKCYVCGKIRVLEIYTKRPWAVLRESERIEDIRTEAEA